MFDLKNNNPIYDPVSVQPLRDELIYTGFKEILTTNDVEQTLNIQDKTILYVLNSVCGCAAGTARPGINLSLQNSIIPDILVTSFAGQDREAIDYLRQKYLQGIPPSSPFIILFKNNEILYMMQRFNIENKPAELLAEELIKVYQKYCNRQGPSIPKEDYEKLVHAKTCGSKIPLAK